MGAIIPVILSFLTQVIPALTSSAQIASAVDLIKTAAPLVIETYQDLAPVIKNAISLVKGTGKLTDAQWAELDAIEKQIDENYDKASRAAAEEDSAQT